MKLAFLSDNIIIIIVAVLSFLAIIFLIYIMTLRLKHRFRKNDLDNIDGHDFEYYCADLLRQRGFIDVSVTKGSGDYGIDILAEKDGVTYAIQCKAYASPVGVKAIQEAFAGKEYYDRMVGAVLTNQYFTGPALEAARKLKILLWDRGYLDSMLEESKKSKN